MKTFKYLACALAAMATLSVGCVNDGTECEPGTDKGGQQIYISNSTQTFYVRTADEKETKAAEMAQYSHGVATKAATEDDKDFTVVIARKNGTAVYNNTLTVSMPTTQTTLFTLPAGSAEKGTTMVGDVEYTQYSVPFGFAEGESETGVTFGFDIAALKSNVDYKFNAALDDEANTSSYGSSSFDFKVVHAAPVHNPWVEVGKVELSEDWYDLGTKYEMIITIHEHDFTDDSFIEVGGEKVINPDKTKRTLKTQSYYRFCIPYYMYQMACASLELGDGTFSEADAEAFSECDGLIFQLDKNFDFVYDMANKKYALPTAEDISAGGNQLLRGAWGYIHSTGGLETLVYDGVADFNSGLRASWYFYSSTSYSDGWHAANNYSLMLMLCDYDAGSLYGATCTFNFDWTENDLVEDWENFFKVDYNNDIDYLQIAEGNFTSEFAGGSVAGMPLYKGVDPLYKNEVYFIYNPYGTATAKEIIGIAVIAGQDGKIQVPSLMPTGLQLLGKDLYMSQSDDIPSTIEVDDSGNLKTLTAAIKFHFEDGNKIGDYKESIEVNGANTVDAFLGTFNLQAYEMYSPYQSGVQPKLSLLSSTVTITKGDNPGEVLIDGMIDSEYAAYFFAGQQCTLKGTFDAVSNTIRVPAQYFMNGKDATNADGVDFAFFQPGETDYNAYNTSSGPYWMSELVAEAPECAIWLDSSGALYLANSLSDMTGTAVDGFSVEMYEANKAGDGFESAGSLYCTLGLQSYFPTFVPMVTSSKPAIAKAANGVKFENKPISSKQSKRFERR